LENSHSSPLFFSFSFLSTQSILNSSITHFIFLKLLEKANLYPTRSLRSLKKTKTELDLSFKTRLSSFMATLPLTFEQISQDLESIEEFGVDTLMLAQLVRDSGASEISPNQSTALFNPSWRSLIIILVPLTNRLCLKSDFCADIGDISGMMSRIAQMSGEELEREVTRVNGECSASKEKLHEAVYESGMLFVKISDWMKETRKDFEEMMATLKTIQSNHDSVINVTTTNP
jgi:hypothetical protein